MHLQNKNSCLLRDSLQVYKNIHNTGKHTIVYIYAITNLIKCQLPSITSNPISLNKLIITYTNNYQLYYQERIKNDV